MKCAKYIQKQREQKVVKANELIQNTRFNLSTQEQKLILYLISKIKPNDVELEEHEFNIKEFCQVCGIDDHNGKNYRDVKGTIKKLADRSVWIKLDNNKESLIRWINKAWMFEQSGTIILRLDDDLKPYLLQLREKFTQYQLIYTIGMKSQYSIRIYELLKSYENMHSKTFDISELKAMLFAETYTRYPDFKRYVLDIALREINSLTDISIDFEAIKKGKKFAKIEFSIKTKEDIIERLKVFAALEKLLNK